MRYGLITAIAAVVLVTTTAAATAQDATADENQASAEQLFADGRDLMRKADYAAACPKLEASLDLNATLATQLTLARCYEALGRLIRAWEIYRAVEKLAKEAGQMGREALAHEAAKSIEARLPRIVLKFADGARVPGLVIRRGDVEIEASALDAPIFVDAGDHLIIATAPGYEPFSRTVTAAEASEAIVEIPALTPTPAQPASSPVGGPSVPAAGLTEPVDNRPARSRRGRQRLGLSLGAAGLVTILTGVGFGWSAKANWEDAFNQGLCNRDTLICRLEGQEKTDIARSRADLAAVITGAGALLVATGVVFYLTAPKDRPRGRARIIPSVDPRADSVGVAVIGRF